ncbi:MAG TPA: hypothetical protein PLF44_08990 [Candidatus Mcinerneyibacteriales bacterium]|nr:hypothetical protein [Candidatus Mcinerneyibacteriales bacterium]HPQ90234.1 hypothetical protein [Candidatus Mcinerneyibacteriales bacterium]
MMLLAFILLGTAALLWGLITREVVYMIRRSTGQRQSFSRGKRSAI